MPYLLSWILDGQSSKVVLRGKYTPILKVSTPNDIQKRLLSLIQNITDNQVHAIYGVVMLATGELYPLLKKFASLS